MRLLLILSLCRPERKGGLPGLKVSPLSDADDDADVPTVRPLLRNVYPAGSRSDGCSKKRRKIHWPYHHMCVCL